MTTSGHPENGAAKKPVEYPLRHIAEEFTRVTDAVATEKNKLGASGQPKLSLSLFVAACDALSILFSILGIAFAFAGRDYVDKVKDLQAACADFETVEDMMEKDMAAGTVKVKGSHTRNVLRVVRGLEMNRRLFQYMLDDSSEPLKAVAGRAYEEVFYKHHSWAIRSLVSAGLLTLPTSHQFLAHLHEDDTSWRSPAEQFVKNVAPVIAHVESLFTDRDLGLDW